MFRELDVVRKTECGNVGHHVISTVRRVAFEASVAKNRHNEITFELILMLQLLVITPRQAHRVRARMLQRIRCTDRKKIVNLSDSKRDLRRGDTIADAPPGDRIRFRK